MSHNLWQYCCHFCSLFGVMVMSDDKIENFPQIENKIDEILKKVELLSKGLHFHINNEGDEMINEIRKDLRKLHSGVSRFRWAIDALKNNINDITRTCR